MEEQNTFTSYSDGNEVVLKFDYDGGSKWASVRMTPEQAQRMAKSLLAAAWRAEGGEAPAGAPIGSISMRPTRA